jgi:GH25 family lysozyme M1 (1,4-beta-N-acetylmuramidase)
MTLSIQIRRQVESKLMKLGFKPGTVDGVIDAATKAALARYAKADAAVPNKTRKISPAVIKGLNAQVKALERNLKVLGAKLGKADTFYGDATTAAVKNFQRKHKLDATGIANGKTRAAIRKTMYPKYVGANSTWKPDVPQKKYQHGFDTSHFQSQATFNNVLNQKSTRFMAIKATEGTGFVDPTFKSRWAQMGKKLEPGKFDLRIAYHFLRPGNGAAQANKFLDAVGVHGKLKPGTRLAIDWEASALSSPSTLRDCAKRIHDVTGAWPLIYCSASRVAQARKIVPNAPIWDAHWSPEKSDFKNPFVQVSGSPIDRDVFAGSELNLRRWAGWL